MYINRHEADRVHALVERLKTSGNAGIDLSILSLRAGCTTVQTEALLRKYSDYFVRVGSKRSYVLNAFGPFGGSAERIAEDIERSCKEGRNALLLSGALITLAVTGFAFTIW